MRMRHKKHGEERIAACSAYRIGFDDLLRTRDPQSFFPVPGPLHLEIGCGKGRFSCELANRNPTSNFIAMERVPNVACNALENARARYEGVTGTADNLRILIGNAEHLAELFPEHSIAVIYLNFSDPWPKTGYAKRRLTHTRFLDIYRKILIPGGLLRLKTDNAGLFAFSLEEFQQAGLEVLWKTDDLHHETGEYAEQNVQTEYESAFSSQGIPIHMAVVRF